MSDVYLVVIAALKLAVDSDNTMYFGTEEENTIKVN